MRLNEALKNLNDADHRVFETHRTAMRRTYMNAHFAIMGANNWSSEDSANLDEIDRQIIHMMVNAGRQMREEDKPNPPFEKKTNQIGGFSESKSPPPEDNSKFKPEIKS